MKSLAAFLVASFAPVAAFGAIVEKPVAYEHDGVKCIGWLAYDDSGDARRPGVLVVPEWWGLNGYVKNRAHRLAGSGYVAFVADMYGDGIVTTDAKRAGELAGAFYGKPLMAARARAALDTLLRDVRVDGGKVAAIGYCFGGSTVQALAYSGAPLNGIVSFHGGLLPVPEGAGVKNHTKFLMLNGAADPMVKPEAVAAFEKDADREKIDYQFVNYAGALHAFSNPEATELAAKNGLSAAVGYQETAARRSWAQMSVFFGEVLAPGGH